MRVTGPRITALLAAIGIADIDAVTAAAGAAEHVVLMRRELADALYLVESGERRVAAALADVSAAADQVAQAHKVGAVLDASWVTHGAAKVAEAAAVVSANEQKALMLGHLLAAVEGRDLTAR